jgi:hypothetical protein
VQAQAAQDCHTVLRGLGFLLTHNTDDRDQGHVHDTHVATPHPAATQGAVSAEARSSLMQDACYLPVTCADCCVVDYEKNLLLLRCRCLVLGGTA